MFADSTAGELKGNDTTHAGHHLASSQSTERINRLERSERLGSTGHYLFLSFLFLPLHVLVLCHGSSKWPAEGVEQMDFALDSCKFMGGTGPLC